jgi:hypothetical protein
MPINCGGAAGTSALANWAAVRSIVDGTTGGQVSCQGADCHTTGDRQPYMIGLTGPLSDDDLYTTLTTFVAPRCGNRVMVKPCDPDGSAFWRAQAGMCEGLPPMVPLPRMPFGCRPEYDQCTSPDQLDGIRQWIATGASR